ncbi:hypothetical protein K491DRAFT_684073 [Lophiostoma macrostomum CBS 122681]|uniref:Uncharacterized protein n=1 Tax=Lophiostoma macrostomum CBS 122681 TaxID=1314788 RepID=A0A6A6SNQ5_9PLEO|nr:hypothetical protein K491DRAFT_684073 [Lophiostoma macrostomum CBS 122681]
MVPNSNRAGEICVFYPRFHNTVDPATLISPIPQQFIVTELTTSTIHKDPLYIFLQTTLSPLPASSRPDTLNPTNQLLPTSYHLSKSLKMSAWNVVYHSSAGPGGRRSTTPPPSPPHQNPSQEEPSAAEQSSPTCPPHNELDYDSPCPPEHSGPAPSTSTSTPSDAGKKAEESGTRVQDNQDGFHEPPGPLWV